MTGSPKEYQLNDIHYAVLSALPDEGSKLGYHPLVKTSRRLMDELNAPLPPNVPKVTSGEVNAALRQLRQFDLTVIVRSGVRLIGWQATPKGRATVSEWSSPFANGGPS